MLEFSQYYYIMVKNLNKKVNIFNGLAMFLLVVLVEITMNPALVELINSQPWGGTALVIITFLAGLLTRFYRHEDSIPEETEVELEDESEV